MRTAQSLSKLSDTELLSRVRGLYVRSGGSGGKFTAGAGGKNGTTAQGLFAALERACGPARQLEVRRSFTLEFTVEPAFMEKIERIRALLSTKHRKKLDVPRGG